MQAVKVLAQKTRTIGLPLNDARLIGRRLFRGVPDTGGAGSPMARWSIS